MASVQIDRISKSFDGSEVLNAVSVTVEDGQFLVLLGPSGCGKSTLLRIVSGLESPDEGRIVLGESDVTALQPRDRNVAMVFQNYALYPHMTVRENIAFPLKMARMGKAEIADRSEETARLLGLEEMLDRKPRSLSGGQRQRVALGRALVRDPQVFLFDEPLSNLDARLRVSMRIEILRLMRSLKATVIYVTHDQEEALTMGDRVAVLDGGVVQQIDTPAALYERPANLFVAGFVGSPRMNLIQAELISGEVLVSGLKVARLSDGNDTQDGSVTLGIRPHDCRLDDSSDIRMDVISREYVGSHAYIHGKLQGHDFLIATAPSRLDSSVESIGIAMDDDRIHLFGEDGVRLR